MNESANLWDGVDEPVLKFVATFPYKYDLRLNRNEASEEIPSMTGEELDASLRRLMNFGLITWRSRSETSGFFHFTGLRLSPDGLRVLGHWPPTEEAMLGGAVVQILRALADEAETVEESKQLKRAAGVVARFAGDVVFDVAKNELTTLGEDSV
jgi:hypothetical protein